MKYLYMYSNILRINVKNPSFFLFKNRVNQSGILDVNK